MTDIITTETEILENEASIDDVLEEYGIEQTRALFIDLVDNYNVGLLKSETQKFLDNPDYIHIFEEIALKLIDSDTVLDEELWSLLIYSSEEVRTIGELVDASVYQSQFSVLSEAVNSLLCDKYFGFASVGYFLSPVEVIEGVQGSDILAGGHHRLFVMCFLLRSLGNAEWDDIFKQSVPVHTVKVNKKVLEGDKLAAAIGIESVLWMASNGSRKPTPVEKDSFKYTKQGVSLTDASSIVDNPTLNAKQRFELLFLSTCMTQGIIADRNGQVMRNLTIDPAAASKEERIWQSPKPNTLSALAGSFYGALSKIQIEIPKGQEVLDAKGKVKKAPFKWLPDLEKYPSEIIEMLFAKDDRTGSCLIEEAIRAAIKQDPDNRNISRTKAKHGQVLAQLLDKEELPRIKVKPTETGIKKGNTRKTGLARRYA